MGTFDSRNNSEGHWLNYGLRTMPYGHLMQDNIFYVVHYTLHL